MFYSENVLTRKGPLANIWLAAHWDRKLTKAQIVQTNIKGSVDEIVKGGLPPMALRLSGQLLLGASRIYWRKARYLLEDCSESLDRLKLNFKMDAQVDMPHEQSRAPLSSITLATNYPTAASNLLLPEADLDLDEILNMVSTQQPTIANASTAAGAANLLAGKAGADLSDGNDSINMREKFNLNKTFGFEKSESHRDSLTLQAFPMSEDFEIEAGRRLTGLSALNMSRDTNPFGTRTPEVGGKQDGDSTFLLEDPSGIETGRKDAVSLGAFSPLRLSSPGRLAFDQQDGNSFMADDDGHGDLWAPNDHDGAAANSPGGLQAPSADQPFNTPPRPTKSGGRKRRAALDEITELSSSQIQKQVKDTSDIIVGSSGAKSTNPGRKQRQAMIAPVSEEIAGGLEENRHLSLTAMAAPEDAAALLARPAIDGDLVMDAFGDLFKNNPLMVLVSRDEALRREAIAAEVPATPFVPALSSMATPLFNGNGDAPFYDEGNDDSFEPVAFLNSTFIQGTPIIPTESVSINREASQIDLLAVLHKEAGKKPATFQILMAGKTRPVVAKSFFDILALSSRGNITAQQGKPFGPITLSMH